MGMGWRGVDGAIMAVRPGTGEFKSELLQADAVQQSALNTMTPQCAIGYVCTHATICAALPDCACSSPYPPQLGWGWWGWWVCSPAPFLEVRTHWSSLMCKNLKNSRFSFQTWSKCSCYHSQGISNKWRIIFLEIPAGRERAS